MKGGPSSLSTIQGLSKVCSSSSSSGSEGRERGTSIGSHSKSLSQSLSQASGVIGSVGSGVGTGGERGGGGERRTGSAGSIRSIASTEGNGKPVPERKKSSSFSFAEIEHLEAKIIADKQAKVVALKKAASKFYCQICMHKGNIPAASKKCGHVFCDQCWVTALKTKSCCPSCRAATTKEDLRIVTIKSNA